MRNVTAFGIWSRVPSTQTQEADGGRPFCGAVKRNSRYTLCVHVEGGGRDFSAFTLFSYVRADTFEHGKYIYIFDLGWYLVFGADKPG